LLRIRFPCSYPGKEKQEEHCFPSISHEFSIKEMNDSGF